MRLETVMKLFTTSTSPNGRRVNIALAEKGITIEKQEMDLAGAENLSEDFKSKNPFGRVPVLQLDDGSYLSESVAITRYLDCLHPTPPLFGITALEQAQVEMWNRRVELNLLVPVAQAFRNLTGFFKDREEISKEWGQISAKIAQDTFPLFDAQLAGTEFIAGDTFSVADISLLCVLDFARATRQGPENLVHLDRWYSLVSARPSAKA
jgi:glutathione S-transferase